MYGTTSELKQVENSVMENERINRRSIVGLRYVVHVVHYRNLLVSLVNGETRRVNIEGKLDYGVWGILEILFQVGNTACQRERWWVVRDI